MEKKKETEVIPKEVLKEIVKEQLNVYKLYVPIIPIGESNIGDVDLQIRSKVFYVKFKSKEYYKRSKITNFSELYDKVEKLIGDNMEVYSTIGSFGSYSNPPQIDIDLSKSSEPTQPVVYTIMVPIKKESSQDDELDDVKHINIKFKSYEDYDNYRDDCFTELEGTIKKLVPVNYIIADCMETFGSCKDPNAKIDIDLTI